jgi:hypothetical protein
MHAHARTRTRAASDGVTAGEKAFMYGMALMGFFFILCAPPLPHICGRKFVQNALFAPAVARCVHCARHARSGACVQRADADVAHATPAAGG